MGRTTGTLSASPIRARRRWYAVGEQGAELLVHLDYALRLSALSIITPKTGTVPRWHRPNSERNGGDQKLYLMLPSAVVPELTISEIASELRPICAQ